MQLFENTMPLCCLTCADAGPLDQIDAPDSDEEDLLPPTTAGGAAGETDLPGTGGKKAAAARTRCVSLSPTGRAWAAATTEGVLMYSLDEGLVFDPTDLTEDATPAAALRALSQGAYLKALLLALRLGEPALLAHALLSTPPPAVGQLAGSVPAAVAPALLAALAELAPQTPHLEYILTWVQALCLRHGPAIQASPGAALPALRGLQKALTRLHEDLSSTCESNLYTLDYLCAVGRQQQQAAANGTASGGAGGGAEGAAGVEAAAPQAAAGAAAG